MNLEWEKEPHGDGKHSIEKKLYTAQEPKAKEEENLTQNQKKIWNNNLAKSHKRKKPIKIKEPTLIWTKNTKPTQPKRIPILESTLF